MPSSDEIARLAPAYGFEVTDLDPEMVTLGYGLGEEVWLLPDEGPEVFAIIARGTWDYQTGYEWAESEIGFLPLREMLSHLAWCQKVEAEMVARMEAMYAEEPDIYLSGPEHVQERQQ